MTDIRLGELQLRIMQVLWQRPHSTVAEVHQALGGSLAYTTIATMLRKMEERELVAHEERGRRFVYAARIAPEVVSEPIANDLIDRVFGGSLSEAVHHLLSTRDIEPDELDRLEQLIQQHRDRE